MDKQQIINELSKLYRLKEEGKKVQPMINSLEAKLREVCEDELDKTTQE